MRNIFVYASLFFSFIGNAQSGIVNIPDANFKAALVNDLFVDTNFNGEIEIEEAEAFNGALEIAYKNIQDLTGIEAFVNVTEIWCSNNQLTSLDLSNNLQIELLVCHGNQLNNLVLGDNTVLWTLGCENNQLTNLDITNNTGLKYLYCNNNQITDLDLSNNVALKKLNCENNQLSTLNIANGTNTIVESFNATNNPNLVCIKIDENFTPTAAWVKDNQANFSVNCGEIPNPDAIVNIPDANFKNALINHNPTIDSNADGEIQVSEAVAFNGEMTVTEKNISNLTGIEAFVNLSNLYCSDNQLTTVDLSMNTALKVFTCDRNQLTSIDVTNNPNLESISVEENLLTSLDISNNPNLEGLHCSNNQLTSLDTSNNPQLSTLYCDNNQISSLDLSQNSLLMNFHCRSNQLSNLNLEANTTLFFLDCGGNQLTALDLSSNISIITLLCDTNQITDLDLSLNIGLWEFKCFNNQLQTLNIANANNTNINEFNATNNPNLVCIKIDENFTPTAAWLKDDSASFNTDCSSGISSSVLYNSINIYPNPTIDILHIEYEKDIESVIIYDERGTEVHYFSRTKSINVSDLASGIYFLEVVTKEGKTIKQFIKK